jgi:hypothetical protein
MLLFASSYLPSVKDILDKSISAIGFQICFYMSLAGFACAWYYRAMLTGSFMSALTHIWWPLFSAMFMVFIAVLSALSFYPNASESTLNEQTTILRQQTVTETKK